MGCEEKRIGRHTTNLLVVTGLICMGGTAVAADADNGSRLARRWCAPCHVVAPNQARPTGEARHLRALQSGRTSALQKLRYSCSIHIRRCPTWDCLEQKRPISRRTLQP